MLGNNTFLLRQIIIYHIMRRCPVLRIKPSIWECCLLCIESWPKTSKNSHSQRGFCFGLNTTIFQYPKWTHWSLCRLDLIWLPVGDEDFSHWATRWNTFNSVTLNRLMVQHPPPLAPAAVPNFVKTPPTPTSPISERWTGQTLALTANFVFFLWVF